MSSPFNHSILLYPSPFLQHLRASLTSLQMAPHTHHHHHYHHHHSYCIFIPIYIHPLICHFFSSYQSHLFLSQSENYSDSDLHGNSPATDLVMAANQRLLQLCALPMAESGAGRHMQADQGECEAWSGVWLLPCGRHVSYGYAIEKVNHLENN